MAIRGVIFDLDGTVADTLRLCYFCYREVFKKYLGNDLSDVEIAEKFGPTERGIFFREVPNHCEDAFQMFFTLYKQHHDECPDVFPGLRDLLDELEKQHIKMAMVTGKGAETTEYSVKYFNLENRFHPVKIGSEQGNAKAACMEAVVSEWGFTPDEVLSVGDTGTDIEAARQAGVVPISAAWASTVVRQDLESRNPAAIFDRVDDFRSWIREKQGAASVIR